MEFVELINELKAKRNGAYIGVVITKPASGLNAKAKKEHEVIKTSSMVVRKGIAYDKLKSVKEKIAKGYEVKELPWGKWIPGYEGLFIEHKNEIYVRLYPNQIKSSWNVDGNTKTFAELKETGLFVDSFFKEKTPSEVMTINIRYLDKIK